VEIYILVFWQPFSWVGAHECFERIYSFPLDSRNQKDLPARYDNTQYRNSVYQNPNMEN